MKKGMPLWRQQRYIPRGLIPLPIAPWLFDAASLTQRLRQVCQGRFQVRVVSQRRVRPLRDERVALRMRDHEHALVRMVYLLCDGQPWVFARTVIPAASLRGPRRRLLRLGNRPLGALLFADPHMQRGPVEVVCVPSASALLVAATHGMQRRPQAIWGRRSLFRLGGKPLLVSEFFLPALLAHAR